VQITTAKWANRSREVSFESIVRVISLRLMRRGFFGDEDVGAGVLFVGGEDLLFVVAALGVDFPRVELGAAEEA